MPFTWESQLAAILKQKRLRDIVGKFNCEFYWSLNVSLKVNCRPKFISSDNIFFVRRNEQLCFQSCPQGHSIDKD